MPVRRSLPMVKLPPFAPIAQLVRARKRDLVKPFTAILSALLKPRSQVRVLLGVPFVWLASAGSTLILKGVDAMEISVKMSGFIIRYGF